MDIDPSYIVLMLISLFLFLNRKKIASSPYNRGGNIGCFFFLVIVVGGIGLYTFITSYPENKRLREEVEKTKIEDISNVELKVEFDNEEKYRFLNLIDTSFVISDRSQIKTILNGIQSARSARSDRSDREWKVKLRLNYKNNTYKQFLVERIDRSGPIYICLLGGDNINNKVYISQVTDLDFVLLLNKYREREEIWVSPRQD